MIARMGFESMLKSVGEGEILSSESVEEICGVVKEWHLKGEMTESERDYLESVKEKMKKKGSGRLWGAKMLEEIDLVFVEVYVRDGLLHSELGADTRVGRKLFE